MSIPVAGLLALFAIVPYVVLQGRARRRYAMFDVASLAVAALAFFIAPHFDVTFGSVLVALLLARFAGFHLFLLLDGSKTRWTANVAGLFALVVYLLLVPQVLQWAIDGDEPYYVLVTESIARDGDLDLANQYGDLAHSATGRKDLRPQLGDPVGPRGEQFSRHEPFLPLLLVPGYLAAGLAGCVATIALFGALLVRSTLRLLDEEGFSDRARVVVAPFLSFGPPVIFYADRIWPEVPAAWMFAEMLRAGLRVARNASSTSAWLRLGLAGLGLSLIKIRFLPIAVLLLIAAIVVARKQRTRLVPIAIAVAVAIVPMLVLQYAAGSPFNVHVISEMVPQHPEEYLRGLFGSLLDAERGMLFRAPIWLFALWGLFRWKEAPVAFRLGAIASVAYLLLLFPRAEWDGGWSPPLRYLVVFVPLFAAGLAFAVERIERWSLFAIASIVTFASSILAVVAPYRLFHLANGESLAGEWLSKIYQADVSRVLPSFIRVNRAAIVFAIAFSILCLLAIVIRRRRFLIADPIVAAIGALLLAGGFAIAKEPGPIVHLEDAHVTHHGGKMYPSQWTVGRFMFEGGWTLREGEWASFQGRGGKARLWYMSEHGATIELNGRSIALPATGSAWRAAQIDEGRRGVARLVMRSGDATFDRIEHE